MLIYGIGAITVLLCFCGLALDLGSFELTRLRMQGAADAAALGAVVASQSGGSMSTAGLQDASQNGFTSGTGGVTVTITNPPSSGNYTGNTAAAQAIIAKKVSGTFLPAKFTLTAQATALATPTSCVYLLSQHSTQPSLSLSNQSTQANCSFYLGSSYSFSGANTSGSQFYVSGASNNSSGSVSPAPIFKAPLRSDPLSGVPAPSAASCTYTNKAVSGSSVTLSPGTYCGGLAITKNATVNLQAGTYVIQGALTISSSTVNGSGVTFYLSQGNGYSYGASSVSSLNGSLSAPTSGPLQGILIFADRTLPAGQATLPFANLNSATRMDGIIYLPGQEFSSSNSTLEGKNYFGLVADFCAMSNTNFSPSANYSSLAGGSPFQVSGAGLVE